MTNKQLYNLVFENFIQAKKELIKEGYRKDSVNEVDFNEVFSQTKHKMLEEKLKSLQRENKMLKNKLQKEGLMGSMGSTGGYETGGIGSEGFWNFLTKVAAMAGNPTAKADIVANRLIKNGKLTSLDSDRFKMNLISNLKQKIDFEEAVLSALRKVGARNSVMAESKIKKLKEGIFDMFGKKGGQPQTQQREPKQVWLGTLTKVFGDELKGDFNKMDDKTLENFYKPINNLFIEKGTESFWGGLKGILERTDGVNFKDLDQQYFLSISKELMLLKQLRNLFTIIETNPSLDGKRRFTSDALWLYTNNDNKLKADVLDMLYRKSKAYNQPISKILDLINTYAAPRPQNLAESKRRRY